MARFVELVEFYDGPGNVVLVMDSEKELPLFKAMMVGTMDQLFQRIRHGDQEHQDWLQNELKDFVETLTIHK